VRRKFLLWLSVGGSLAGAATLAGWLVLRGGDAGRANPDDIVQVAYGHTIYLTRCASCHGIHLEGQPNWREHLPNGRLPAPPHNAEGHTWHHPDRQLFQMVKYGLASLVPGYQTDMPIFKEILSDDEIWAVLAYIESQWPPHIRQARKRINRQAAD